MFHDPLGSMFLEIRIQCVKLVCHKNGKEVILLPCLWLLSPQLKLQDEWGVRPEKNLRD